MRALPNEPPVSYNARHNLARVGTLRRTLGIPNPINHASVAVCIDEHWNEISTILDASVFSQTRPIVSGTHDRSFHASPQSQRVALRAELCPSARFLVRADISRFYASIYTHSIPWAIHGKDITKRPENRGDGYWGNRLDRLFRKMEDRQTVGIPIGPDASQVVAELILCRVDEKMHDIFPRLKGFRFIDDFEFGASTRTEAEKVLAALENELSAYELELNPLKTGIYELPVPFEQDWVHRLRSIGLNSETATRQHGQIVHLFDAAFVEQKANPTSSVVRYALRQLSGLEIHEDNYKLCEQLACHCAIIEPSSMRYAFHVLERLHILGYEFVHFFECVTSIIEGAVRKHHGSELCWALYALLRFRAHLAMTPVTALGDCLKQCNDPLAKVLTLQCVRDGLIANDLLRENVFESSFNGTALWDDNWLFAYEAGVQFQDGYITADDHFGPLKESGVRFFKDVGLGDTEEIDLPDQDEEYTHDGSDETEGDDSSRSGVLLSPF